MIWNDLYRGLFSLYESLRSTFFQLYIHDKPARGKLEITDLNRIYLEDGTLDEQCDQR